jgi:DNA-binding XRE family transcriptional regulator
MEVEMSLHDTVPASIEHACTWEERRFGTCHCRPVATPVNEHSRRSAHKSDHQPDREELAAAEQNHAHRMAEFKHHLATAPCRDRLRILRTAMGWTQHELASQLGISRRSVIRYEKSQHGSPWPRLTVLLRLRQVEEEHEQQLLGQLARIGR